MCAELVMKILLVLLSMAIHTVEISNNILIAKISKLADSSLDGKKQTPEVFYLKGCS